jgi:hypothetical protein
MTDHEAPLRRDDHTPAPAARLERPERVPRILHPGLPERA